ncbi:MAG: nucleotide sugar dehydrogenase, partial [Pseudomonadota bacterium]
MHLAIFGLGYVGFTAACCLASQGRREIGDALADADGAIVCVGTPSGPDGGHDMGHVAAVTRQIAEALAQSERTAPLTIA